jgi:glycerol uptake facilitator-like aquaporin
MKTIHHISAPQALFAEYVGTFILVFTVLGVMHRNASLRS